MVKWSTWPNRCTAFYISIASSLLSLERNSGQAASLCPISPNSLPFFFLYTHTRQTARANNGDSSLHISNKHIEHSASYIHSLEAIGHQVAFFACLFLRCTYTEHVKRWAAYIQWAYEHWAVNVWWTYWALSSIRVMSILSIEQHTCDEHIEHWAVNVWWTYWALSSIRVMSILSIEQ